MHKTLTKIAYATAAMMLSASLFSLEFERFWLLPAWLIACATPLLFAFAYPRFLFGDSSPQNRPKYVLVLHAAGVILGTATFTMFSPHWKNPLLDNDSLALLVGGLVAICIFLVAALLLLIRKSSSLTLPASVLFWLYWLAVALIFEGRWFEETGLYAAYYFLCCAVPVLFAFAAGAVSYRPRVAHALVLAGIGAMPRVYWNVIRGS